MVPAPHSSAIPREARWTIVQRRLSWDEIRLLAAAVAKLDGQPLAGNHAKLLADFVQADHKREWLKIWVTIVQTLGLGYTDKEGTVLYATDFGRLVPGLTSSAHFYLFWAVRFQFPHGYPKQKHYIDAKVCIQPIPLLVDYATTLSRISKAGDIYLTYDEVLCYCMKRKTDDATQTERDCREILARRSARYDYAKERAVAGYGQAISNFANRAKLYIEPIGLFDFKPDRLVLTASALKRAAVLMAFRRPAIPFPENTEAARNNYLEKAFSCSIEELNALAAAVQSGKVVLPPVLVLADQEDFQKEEDERVQAEKLSKKDMLAQARNFEPVVGSKISYKPRKVRIDDARQKALIKRLEDFSCQIDGTIIEYEKKGKKLRYIEAAHIQAKTEFGTEKVDNIIVLCPNCHKRLDYGLIKIDMTSRRVVVEGKETVLHHDFHLFV